MTIFPNILITGTPGTGKTTIAKKVCELVPEYSVISVGALVKEHGFHTGRDEELDTFVLDEDPLLDFMEPMMSKGGIIVDHHDPVIFPERWFELIYVIRCDSTEVHWDRLEARKYHSFKIQQNVEAEIHGIISDEAHESYNPKIIFELLNTTEGHLERNVVEISRELRGIVIERKEEDEIMDKEEEDALKPRKKQAYDK
ncbi:Adenylate kinase isoenzyme 6 like protein [Aduncisulcus paluster]|uniref:Adenylate kinase isoenzyme 6 homolog n=1 Tax=Aduncisulcus paluster TaxID=2918883 RepID=A0ABQ5KJ52_9EUKA|nr:Adenylate kinase isoenzyme 6 like protein [Aduncisulcus paluster]